MEYDLGKFASLFREDGLYLRLLHLEGPWADMFGAVDVLRAVVVDCGDDLARELAPLLRDKNWRLKLVAVSALLVAGHKESLPMLWQEIDKPSWVSPQLVAASSLLDDGFEARARERLERQTALEPEASRWATGKVAAALVAVYREMYPGSAWLEAFVQAEDVQALLVVDSGQGGEIAVSWRRRAEAVLMGRG